MRIDFLPHQQRVVDEHKELTERANKLDAFFSSPVFFGLGDSEKTLLKAQIAFMRGYQEILKLRIESFLKS